MKKKAIVTVQVDDRTVVLQGEINPKQMEHLLRLAAGLGFHPVKASDSKGEREIQDNGISSR